MSRSRAFPLSFVPIKRIRDLNVRGELLSIHMTNGEGSIQENATENVPDDQEVVDAVTVIWNDNPATEALGIPKLHALVKNNHPDWSLSANRLKSLLKSHGLLSNAPPVTYVAETESHLTPDMTLPDGIKVLMTKARGKALYASKFLEQGQELWTEQPMVLVAPLAVVPLMRKALACAYCARPFQTRSKEGTPVGASDCKDCIARWCSPECRRADGIHAAMWHGGATIKVDSNKWQKYEAFCLENEWTAAYAYGIVLLWILRDVKKIDLEPKIASLAKVRQDVRQRAIDPEFAVASNAKMPFGDGATLLSEQAETLWKEGYQLLKQAVSACRELTYEEYLYGLGMVSINNLDGNLFLIYSHLNHSCEPNVEVNVLGRSSGIKVVTKRPIRNGEELFTCYVNPADPLPKRRHDLRVNWGFVCNCNRCKEEDREATEVAESQLRGTTPPPMTERTRRKSVRFDEKVDLV